MPLIEGLKVVHSKIHGYGVVATRAFKAGEVIAEVEGVPLRLRDVVDDEYCLWIHDDMYLDMVDQTRWINHSCEPNAEIEGEEESDGRVWARAIARKDIAAGEELTYDYGFALVHAMPCRCATPSCRGYIVDQDELPLLLAQVQHGKASANAASEPHAALAGA